VGVLRRDPMAMLPFAGYNMGDYWAHWLRIGQSLKAPPRIFRTNWFLTGDNGKFLWPGFGDNLRVLKWILERCEGRGDAVDTLIGLTPTKAALDLKGVDLAPGALAALLKVDAPDWAEVVQSQEGFFDSFGDRVPRGIREEHEALARRIQEVVTPADLRGRDSGT
jgi:phosphoenolpyruvate carboxykinase (GTP)